MSWSPLRGAGVSSTRTLREAPRHHLRNYLRRRGFFVCLFVFPIGPCSPLLKVFLTGFWLPCASQLPMYEWLMGFLRSLYCAVRLQLRETGYCSHNQNESWARKPWAEHTKWPTILPLFPPILFSSLGLQKRTSEKFQRAPLFIWCYWGTKNSRILASLTTNLLQLALEPSTVGYLDLEPWNLSTCWSSRDCIIANMWMNLIFTRVLCSWRITWVMLLLFI